MLTNEFKQKCESMAIRVRYEVGLLGYDPLPARQLARHLGVHLIRPEDLPGIDPDALRKALESESWAAIAIPVDPPIVIYHPERPVHHFESDVMHELSHFMLKHVPEKLGKLSDNFVSRCYPKQQEYEADFLADCLQLPRVGLQYARQIQMTMPQMSDAFCVSVDLIQRRMSNSVTG